MLILNGMITYLLVYWKDSFRPEKSLRTKLLEMFCCIGILMNFKCPWLVAAHYFMYPKFPAYIFSILPEFCFNFYTYIIFGLYYVFALHIVFGNLVILANFLCCKMLLLFTILPTEFMGLRNAKKHLYKSRESLRSAEKLFLEYRAMDLLLMKMTIVLGPLIIPVQAVITNLSLFCNYTIIREWDQLDKTTVVILLFWTSGVLVCWLGVLEVGGWLNSGGSKILQSWKHFNWPALERKILNKQKKACRPYAVRVQSYYCIKRLSILKFLKGIVKGTFRALLLTLAKRSRSS